MYRKLFHGLSISLLLLPGSLLCSNSQAAAGTIGPWEISAVPVSASKVVGGTTAVLNILDASVSVNDALSGVSLLDDGILNSLANDEFQLNYASGVALNTAGTDLVLFEARFDAGEYAVSTSFDAFAAEVLFPASSFINSGVDRSYFLYGGGFAGGTAFGSDIWGAEIDLSLLGVPLGVAVDSIRVRATSTTTDLLGVGVLAVPEPSALALFSIGLLSLSYRRRLM